MNERIHELLVEAHTQTKGGIYSSHPSEWSEKFAELIIKECTDVVGTAVDRREPASTYVGKIKQHFGVE